MLSNFFKNARDQAAKEGEVEDAVTVEPDDAPLSGPLEESELAPTKDAAAAPSPDSLISAVDPDPAEIEANVDPAPAAPRKELLIFEAPEPLLLARHRDVSLDHDPRHPPVADISAVPLVAGEITRAGREMPVVFSAQDPVTPVALLGTASGENLFLDSEGAWLGDYIPAFLRQYPFVLAGRPDSSALTLCLDMACDGVNHTGRGERLFTEDGAHSTFLTKTIAFVEAYHKEYAVTRRLCARLEELDLLEAQEVRFRLPAGPVDLRGFRSVSRERVKALDDKVTLELARSGALEVIHAHWASLGAMATLARRAAAG